MHSDASELTMAVVANLMLRFPDCSIEQGFLIGKAKIAPSNGHTIPRLELCAAVIANEI